MDIKEKEALLCSKYDNINKLLVIHKVFQQDREDLIHEIFFKALKKLHQLRDPEKMDAWLWSITRNEVNRYWRHIMKSRHYFRSLEGEQTVLRHSEISDVHYLRLAEEMDRIGDLEELTEALHRLNDKTQLLFRLYYFGGYRLKEIAIITGETESAVKSRHVRGLEKLRGILEEIRQKDQEREETSTFPLEVKEEMW